MTEGFQSPASLTGRTYEDRVVEWLIDQGFTVVARRLRHESGVEFDLLADDPAGAEVGIVCEAADDLWKALGYLWALNRWHRQTGRTLRYVLITSHMPDPGTEQRHLLDLAEVHGEMHVIVVPFPDGDRPA